LIDPIALKLQGLIPLPNTGAPGQTSRNFYSASPRSTHWNQGDVKADQRLFEGNNLMARVSVSRLTQPNQGIFIYSPTERLQNLINAVLSDTHVFSSRVINEFRFGFNRTNSSNIGLKG
jgi:hypothetical protein